MTYQNILLVGCGNMAGAMLDGWLAAGFDPARFTVADPGMKEPRPGVKLLDAIPEGGSFDAVLLGVKPQILADVVPQVKKVVGAGTVLLSILAGVELSVLRDRFANAAGVVRLMPNLAAALGKSPIAVAQAGLDDSGSDAAMAFLKPLGTPEWVAEDEFDLVTALAGSGPAFVYRFIDSLAAAAAELGLAEDKALRLALAMVEGASALAAASPHAPAELARRVASPGGVTQAGLEVMDDGAAMRRLAVATLRAARDRSAEMAAEARGKA
ncbi:pyrroline-5-carboxylate reductase [Altererythrobacter sp. B11]|uniref:pyrroline-5-carboxylate reductase family protein n=1 Tax=Altererythrobacter sp. B11 TaxID=2060312 RepID=UPI000DC73A25|nr:pyrroline-5-carboxylate reductase dimerization domain-containing protein [Altererythrobacter sp. B11]BBC74110.1 pyrroline-5-carboxylate reductase [Altererythrobacter sp. B11]